MIINDNNKSIYTYNELTLTELLNKFFNEFGSIEEILKLKTDLKGNHEGSWQGLNKPTLSEEGAFAQVEKNQQDIEHLISTNAANPYYVFEQYNIVGDGVTDDTENFQNMMNNERKIIIPPNKIIKISDELHLSDKDTFSIDGNGSTLLCEKEGLYRTLIFDHCKNITIRDLYFDMNLKGRTVIDFNYCENYLVENCFFTGYTLEYGWYQTDGGIRIESSTGGKIFNNYFYKLGNGMGTSTETLNRCISVGGDSSDTKIIGNTFNQVSQAIVTDSINIEIINNHFENVEDNCVYCVNESKNVTITNNSIYNCLDEVFVFRGTSDFVVNNNTVIDWRNKFVAISGNVSNLIVTNNLLKSENVQPANVFCHRSDYYNYTLTNSIFSNNIINLALGSSSEAFSLGNVNNLDFSNNLINLNVNSNIFGLRGTVCRIKIENNTFDNTNGEYCNLLINPVEKEVTDIFIGSNKLIHAQILMPSLAIVQNQDINIISDSSTYITESVGHRIMYSAKAPTNPVKGKRGDIVYSLIPSAGGYVGWICTEGDGTSLGTWKGFGLIQS